MHDRDSGYGHQNDPIILLPGPLFPKLPGIAHSKSSVCFLSVVFNPCGPVLGCIGNGRKRLGINIPAHAHRIALFVHNKIQFTLLVVTMFFQEIDPMPDPEGKDVLQ